MATWQTPKQDWTPTNGVADADFNRIEGNTQFLKDTLDSGVILNPALGFGMNTKIVNAGEVSALPKFQFTGACQFNVLGIDGNCEDATKWSQMSTTTVTDTNNKVFGSSAIKVTVTTGNSEHYAYFTPPYVKAGVPYLFSLYIKAGIGKAYGRLIAWNGGTVLYDLPTVHVSDTTKFTRVGVLMPANAGLTSVNIRLQISNASDVGSYTGSTENAFFDGIMINEVTAADYSAGVAACLTKYPYVEGFVCLKNPYIEVRHDNIVRNGNGEEGLDQWMRNTGITSFSLENGRFKLVSNGSGACSVSQIVPVKPNTNYYISCNKTGATAIIRIYDGTSNLISSNGTFNSGSNNYVTVLLIAPTASEVDYFDSIMLIEGTVAPSVYKYCRIERCVLETQLTADDVVTFDNGEVDGYIYWKHKTLLGLAYDWKFASDKTNFKQIYTTDITVPYGFDTTRQVLVKFDGKPLTPLDTTAGYDRGTLDNVNLAISVQDTDSGWTDTVNPNDDEVKCFMNGWKAIYLGNNGSRYLVWRSVVDGSFPKAFPSTTVSAAATYSSVFSVVSAAGFQVGDPILVNGWYFTITGISGNNITVNTQLTVGVGNEVAKCDPLSGGGAVLSYCKKFTAPGYRGYQAHYKLAAPEALTDDNVHIHGDIPKIDVGDNYVLVDSGMRLDEQVLPYYYSGTGNYYINAFTLLQYKTEFISAIYKNMAWDTDEWSLEASPDGGNQRASTPLAKVNPNASYTVDYRIIIFDAPQIGSVTSSYAQDVFSAITKIEEIANNRQAKDSALDQMVDLSIYEYMRNANILTLPWRCDTGAGFWMDARIPFAAPKKAVPEILVSPSVGTPKNWQDLTGKCSFAYVVDKYAVYITIQVNDSQAIADIKGYGAYLNYIIIANCKGRLV